MSEPSLGTPPSERPLEDRLDSWKEIAAYLKRDVTTVQRWEKREGMPVHRHLHDRMGSVYASRAELDAWTRSRNLQPAQENGNDATSPDPPTTAPPATPTSLTRWTLVLPLAAAAGALAIGVGLWLQRTEYFWRNPIADARFQTVTDFDGLEQAAAVSRDGHFVAFLSDRDGQMDVWVTQVGSGEFHNLTHGSVPELVNPSIRTLGFSPDGSLVTFWVRKPGGSSGGELASGRCLHWAASRGHTLKAWPSSTGRATAPGSRTTRPDPETRCSCQTAAGDRRAGPSSLRPPGSTATFRCGRPTRHSSTSFRARSRTNWTSGASVQPVELLNGSRRTMARVSYPVLLDQRTLMYLASDPDGSGPWLYSMDVERRIPHRLTSGLDRYTSLAASADGRRLVVTLATPDRTLWRLRIADSPAEASKPDQISADDQHRVLSATGSRIIFCMFLRPARTRASGSSPTEPAQSCGAARERRSLAARPSPPMDSMSHSQSGNTGKRSCT